MAFAENLCRLQAEKEESNYRLAKELGVHASSIAHWREGKTKPLPVYLEKLAAHFGVTVEEMKS